MSGSGKGLLGMWLYRRGEEWSIRESSQLHESQDVSNFSATDNFYPKKLSLEFHRLNISNFIR